MPRGEEGAALTHLRAALAEVSAAEAAEDCGWCRSHVRSLRVLLEDLVRAAELGEAVGRGEIGAWSRRLGAVAEDIGALGMLSRILHRVKGLE